MKFTVVSVFCFSSVSSEHKKVLPETIQRVTGLLQMLPHQNEFVIATVKVCLHEELLESMYSYDQYIFCI